MSIYNKELNLGINILSNVLYLSSASQRLVRVWYLEATEQVCSWIGLARLQSGFTIETEVLLSKKDENLFEICEKLC